MKKKTTVCCLQALTIRKGTKNSLREDVAIVESLDTKQQIALTRKATRKRVQRVKLKKETQKTKRDHKGKETLICLELNATIVVNLDILHGTA